MKKKALLDYIEANFVGSPELVEGNLEEGRDMSLGQMLGKTRDEFLTLVKGAMVQMTSGGYAKSDVDAGYVNIYRMDGDMKLQLLFSDGVIKIWDGSPSGRPVPKGEVGVKDSDTPSSVARKILKKVKLR